MDYFKSRLPWHHSAYRRMYRMAILCGFLASSITSAIYHWNAFSQGQGKFGSDEVIYLFLVPAFALAACIFFRDKILDTGRYPLARLGVRITLTIEFWVVGGTILIYSPFLIVHLALDSPGDMPAAIAYMLLMYSVMAIMAFPLIWAIAVLSIWILRHLLAAPSQSDA